MNKVIFQTISKDNYILIEANKTIKYLTYPTDRIKIKQEINETEYNPIILPIIIFNSFSKLLNIQIKEENELYLNNQFFKSLYLQNEESEKLVIYLNNNIYMTKKFNCESNEIDYINLPNDIYNNLIEALKINNFKQVEFNYDYFASKEIIYKNLEEFINLKKYKEYDMFERMDHLDMKLIKEVFINYYKKNIEYKYFKNFIELMTILLKYTSKTYRKKQKFIYDYICHIFKNESKVKTDSEIIELYSTINYLYKELNNLYDYNSITVHYMFNHYNDYNEQIYEIVIFDDENEKYWMGFIKEPIFKFNINYINTYIKKVIDNRLPFDIGIDYSCKKGETFSIIEDIYDFEYQFDEGLKEKCFQQ